MTHTVHTNVEKIAGGKLLLVVVIIINIICELRKLKA